MRTCTHSSTLKLHRCLPPTGAVPVDFIKREPMLFRADAVFAWGEGDALTRRFMRAVDAIWGNLDGVIFDSRHHMLMPGMYPCIPGWHTDDAPRSSDKYNGQPDIFAPEYETEHLLMVVDAGTGSLTQFLVGDVTLNHDEVVALGGHGTNFYKTVDGLLTNWRDSSAPGSVLVSVKSGVIAQFNVHSWHRGVAAKSRGFRFFIRATRHSRHKPQNEVRTNAQVYLTEATYGW